MPSGACDGPCRISSSVPDRAELARARRAAARGASASMPQWQPRPGASVGARERRADHHRVGAAGDRLGQVAGAADAAVGDDVHVAAAGLVHVVAPRRGDVGDRRGHRHADAEDVARRVRGAAAEADEHAGRAGAHEVQRGLVRRAAADDHRHVELVDELLEVERLARRVRPGTCSALTVVPRMTKMSTPASTTALANCAVRSGESAAATRDAAGADLRDARGDEVLADRRGVDLLQARGWRRPSGSAAISSSSGSGSSYRVHSPSRSSTPRPPSRPISIAVVGRDHGVHRRGEHRGVEAVGVDRATPPRRPRGRGCGGSARSRCRRARTPDGRAWRGRSRSRSRVASLRWTGWRVSRRCQDEG